MKALEIVEYGSSFSSAKKVNLAPSYSFSTLSTEVSTSPHQHETILFFLHWS